MVKRATPKATPLVTYRKKRTYKGNSGLGGTIVEVGSAGLSAAGLLVARHAAMNEAASIMDEKMSEVFIRGQNGEWPKLSDGYAHEKARDGLNSAILAAEDHMLNTVIGGDMATILMGTTTLPSSLTYKWPATPHPNAKGGKTIEDIANIHESGKYGKEKRSNVKLKSGKGAINVSKLKPRPWLSTAINEGFIRAEVGMISVMSAHIGVHASVIRETHLRKAEQIARMMQ